MPDNLANVSITAKAVGETLWPRFYRDGSAPDTTSYLFDYRALHGASLMAEAGSDDRLWLSYLAESALQLAYPSN